MAVGVCECTCFLDCRCLAHIFAVGKFAIGLHSQLVGVTSTMDLTHGPNINVQHMAGY